jgi:hypothetical protein
VHRLRDTPAPQAKTAEARRQLARALGDPSISTRKRGWLIAAWSVAHAQKYGLKRVGFNGATWTNDMNLEGWQSGGKATDSKVDIS